MLHKILLKLRPKVQVTEYEAAEHLKAVGVRNEADYLYRQHRLELMRKRTTVKAADSIEELYDTWIIDAIVGLPPVYLARPFWDDDPQLTRPSFKSREEALEYIRNVGGRDVRDVDSRTRNM